MKDDVKVDGKMNVVAEGKYGLIVVCFVLSVACLYREFCYCRVVCGEEYTKVCTSIEVGLT